jgi:molybdopterin converting factor small subunit
MTQLDVLLFASYAEAFGAASVTVSVPDAPTIADVLGALRSLPGGIVLPQAPVVAVDRKYQRGNVAVRPGQEIAIIPPVAGG